MYPDARPNSFQAGLEYQDFVCAILAKNHIIVQNLCSKRYQYEHGENLQGIEIKLDERCTDTNRLSIEVAEKTRNDPSLRWTPSGIMRDDNAWLYIQGNYSIVFLFAKNWLLRWYRLKEPEIQAFNGTIQRFFLPFEIAKVMAAKVIYVDNEEINDGRQLHDNGRTQMVHDATEYGGRF